MKIKNSKVGDSLYVRTNHPLRSFKIKRGDKINLIYSGFSDLSVKEYKNSTFIKCYVRGSVDSVVFIHEGTQHVLPLHLVGVVGLKHDQL